jgi:hypothetical protein
LALALLDRTDGASFIQVALVVDVQLAEGILQREDIRLLELRVFPMRSCKPFARAQLQRRSWAQTLSPLQLDDIHGGGA